MPSRLIRRLVVLVVLAVLMLCTVVAPALAITRAQVLTRALTWINHPVPYSQASFYGGYRTDCSGYVSMCWGASRPGNVTATMHNVSFPIAASQLRPGDVLLKAGSHVRLFVGWGDALHMTYVCYEQTPPRTKTSVWPLAPTLASGYVPYRYDNITESDTTPPSTTASALSSYNIIAMIPLVATDSSHGSGVAHTYYRVDGGAIREGTSANFRADGLHRLEYWSVDRMCNEERHKVTSFSVTPAPSGTLPVFRFYNIGNGSHFYTASGVECDKVLADMWSTYKLDGIAYNINATNADNDDSLFRFFNKKNRSHFYTASATERDSIIANLRAVYNYDGPAYSVAATPSAGATPVYRFYNFKHGTHFYTASESEKNTVATSLKSVYRFEGPAFYLAP